MSVCPVQSTFQRTKLVGESQKISLCRHIVAGFVETFYSKRGAGLCRFHQRRSRKIQQLI